MALFAASALWPGRDRPPLGRLITAMLGAPLVISAIVSLVAFLIAGMSEQSGAGVLQVTIEAAIALALLIFGFTLTFGLAGIIVLWALGLGGRRAWALMGAGMGALAGGGFVSLALQSFQITIIIGFAIAGWAVFMLIRLIAGIGPRRKTLPEPS